MSLKSAQKFHSFYVSTRARSRRRSYFHKRLQVVFRTDGNNTTLFFTYVLCFARSVSLRYISSFAAIQCTAVPWKKVQNAESRFARAMKSRKRSDHPVTYFSLSLSLNETQHYDVFCERKMAFKGRLRSTLRRKVFGSELQNAMLPTLRFASGGGRH